MQVKTFSFRTAQTELFLSQVAIFLSAQELSALLERRNEVLRSNNMKNRARHYFPFAPVMRRPALLWLALLICVAGLNSTLAFAQVDRKELFNERNED